MLKYEIETCIILQRVQFIYKGERSLVEKVGVGDQVTKDPKSDQLNDALL